MSTPVNSRPARARPLLWALYFVGLVVWSFPLLDLAVVLVPVEFGSELWRFGAAGFVLQALPAQLLGLALLLAAAVALEHRIAVRLVAVLCAALALGVVCTLALATLDYLQLRRTVPEPARLRFDVAGWKMMLQAALGAPALAWLSAAALRVTRRADVRSLGRAPVEAGMVVGVGAVHPTRGMP